MFFSWFVYVFWIPLLLWVALYFWFWRFSNPLYLKKMVKKGKKWAVVPNYVAKNPSKVTQIRLENVVFSIVAAALSSYSVAWGLNWLGFEFPEYGFASALLFVVVSAVLYKLAVSRVGEAYQSAYFLEYRRVRYETEKNGTFRSEMDVHNRTVWSFARKLGNAESHGRLWKYVNAMARTKKIPPDIYAETMYV